VTKQKQSWRERLETTGEKNNLPQVCEIDEKMSPRWGTGTVVIPAPKEVNEIMHSVPVGKLITINQIRHRLARKHSTNIG
jgi:hypothetical protein